MASEKSLAGKYKVLVNFSVHSGDPEHLEPTNHSPGVVHTLSHEDAKAMLASGVAIPFGIHGCPECQKLGHRPCSIECYVGLGGKHDHDAYLADMLGCEERKRNSDKRERRSTPVENTKPSAETAPTTEQTEPTSAKGRKPAQ